jgi:hypothetical protein
MGSPTPILGADAGAVQAQPLDEVLGTIPLRPGQRVEVLGLLA